MRIREVLLKPPKPNIGSEVIGAAIGLTLDNKFGYSGPALIEFSFQIVGHDTSPPTF